MSAATTVPSAADGLYATTVHPALWRLLTTSTADATAARKEFEHALVSALLAAMDVTGGWGGSGGGDGFQDALAARMHAVTDGLMAPHHSNFFDFIRYGVIAAPPTPAADAVVTVSTKAATVEAARRVERLLTAVWAAAMSFLMLPTALLGAKQQQKQQHATAGKLPTGVRVVTLAVASAIFSISGVGTTATTTAAAATNGSKGAQQQQQRTLDQSIRHLWYCCALVFLQQLSARNGGDIAAWKAFSAECTAELNARAGAAVNTDNTNTNSACQVELLHPASSSSSSDALTIHSSPSFRLSVESQSLRAWGGGDGSGSSSSGGVSVLSAALLRDTVERTRFRRAALLFKSFTPHMASQAPGAVFALVEVLASFSSAWTAAMAREVPRGGMTPAGRRYFTSLEESNTSNDAVSSSPSSPSSSGGCFLLKGLSAGEKIVADLVAHYSARLTAVLAVSNAHGQLLATVLGATLCSQYGIGGSGGVAGQPTNGQQPSSWAPTAPAAPLATTAAADVVVASSPSTPANVRGRGNTGVVPTAAVVGLDLAAVAAAAAATAAPVPEMSTPVTADAFPSAAATDAFEAEQGSWLPRWDPFNINISSNSSSDDGGAVCLEWEWQLRTFPPLGLLLHRATPPGQQSSTDNSSTNSGSGSLLPYLQPHLFHLCTQLRLGGTTAAQHAEVRERFALCCLATRLVPCAVAHAMFHCAGRPDLAGPATDAAAAGEVDQEGQVRSARLLPGAALHRFTIAMNTYAARADSQIVFEIPGLTTAADGGGGGTGLLDAERQRRLHRNSSRRGGEAAAGMAVDGGGASAAKDSVPVPRDGNLHGARFCVMVFPDIMLEWNALMAATAAVSEASTTPFTDSPASSSSSSSLLTSPARFVLALLAARCYALATEAVFHFATVKRANVFLVPKPSAIVNENTDDNDSNKDRVGDYTVASFITASLTACFDDWQQQQQLESGSTAASIAARYAYLASVLPLLRLMGSYAGGSQTFLVALAAVLSALGRDALAAASSSTSTAASSGCAAAAVARRCLCLSELHLVYVIMPALRVLTASLLLFDRIDGIFACLRAGHDAPGIAYGGSEAEYLHYGAWARFLIPTSQLAQPSRFPLSQVNTRGSNNSHDDVDAVAAAALSLDPFDLGNAETVRAAFAPSAAHPHDSVRCKELESLFNQSLKRINAHNVDYYRGLLLQVMLALPLFVIDKLLTQAVGYENSFLAIHTRLLTELPASILSIVVHHGLLTLRRFAAEEKVTDGGASMNRVSIVATFLAALWRQNTDRLDGAILLRAAEAALRGSARQDMVLGLELLRAIVFQLAHIKLEHEEQFSALQQAALVTPAASSPTYVNIANPAQQQHQQQQSSSSSPSSEEVEAEVVCVAAQSATRFFGKGSMESFRMGRWTSWLTPADAARGLRALHWGLMQRPAAPIPLDTSNSNEENENSSSGSSGGDASLLRGLTIGQSILLHLCRLQSRIYRLQADLDGPMDLVLLTSARDFNTLNDLSLILEELLPSGPPESLLVRVALSHVALRISGKFRLKKLAASTASSKTSSSTATTTAGATLPAPPLPLSDADSPREQEQEEDAVWSSLSAALHGALRYRLLRQLSYFSVGNLVCDERAYDTALAEWKACTRKADPRGYFASGAAATNGSVSLPARGEKRGRDDAPSAAAITATAEALSQADPATVRWLERQHGRILRERAAHRDLFARSATARQRLLEALVSEVLLYNSSSSSSSRLSPDETLTAFATDYLLPRALSSLEDTIFVEQLLSWLLAETRNKASPSSAASAHSRVIDLILTLVTAGLTFFTGLSDGECKRLGHLLAFVMQGLGDETAAEMPPLPAAVATRVAAIQKAQLDAGSAAAAAAAADASGCSNGDGHGSMNNGGRSTTTTATSSSRSAAFTAGGGRAGGGQCSEVQFRAYLSPTPQSLLSLSTARAKAAAAAAAAASTKVASSSVGGATATAASARVHPLQLEAFVCRFLVQLLGNREDIPAHQHRNCFLLLERLDKAAFPACLCSAELLTRVVAPHADKDSRNYASATAVLKALRGNCRGKRALLGPLNAMIADITDGGGAGGGDSVPKGTAATSSSSSALSVSEQAKVWHTLWRTRETFMETRLLAAELAAFGAGRRQSRSVIGLDDDEENEESDVEVAGDEEEEADPEDGTTGDDEEEDDEESSITGDDDDYNDCSHSGSDGRAAGDEEEGHPSDRSASFTASPSDGVGAGEA